jgi:hypothetical protein
MKRMNYFVKDHVSIFPNQKIRNLIMIVFTLLCQSLFAQTDGIPRGAQLPYTRYESENGARGGAAALQQTLNHDYNTIASEATNQKYVSLPSNGSFVEWTATAAFQGVNMRFTMPDNATGTGNNGALALFINGSKIQNINLTSRWAYQYFHTGHTEPVQEPGGKTFMVKPSCVSMRSTLNWRPLILPEQL